MCALIMMAPGRLMRSVILTGQRRRSNVASTLFSASCFFLLAALYVSVGVAAANHCDHVGASVGAAISFDEDCDLEDSDPSSRRELVGNDPGPTQSLVEDGEVLLEIKKRIITDPNNVTFWWKRQGRNRAVNPCKMKSGTKQYWPGIDCTDIGSERRVTSINLSNKTLGGTLSPLIGKLVHLKHLDLSNNQLTGAIPDTLPTGLETLDLSNNLFQFELPATLGSLQVLSMLNISGNNLTGDIPAGLNSCSRLSVVDLSHNGRIDGTIPFQGLENLTTLYLQNNELQGNFVVLLDTFPQLRYVDLSNNNLNGLIPTMLPSSLTVERIDLSGNRFTGILPDAIGNLTSLRELDVSGNNFSGVLPTTLSSMDSLTTFNASRNNISGSLVALGGVQSLRFFDVSFNKLMGSIPTDVVNFTTLLHLNVSWNNLTGVAPKFVPHDEVNANSFLQNVGLCGGILGNACPSGSPTSSTTTKIVSISVGVSVAVAVILTIICMCFRRTSGGKARSSASVSAEVNADLTSEDVRLATENFNNRNYIGRGSMSTVYRGVLPDATVVAVKRLGIRQGEINAAGEKVLEDRFATLAQIRHGTLVNVVRYCCSPDVKALVLEHMPNGTLNSLMYPPRDVEVVREFNWAHRFNAAIAVARGLKYLHHDCPTPTAHGDLKPSNILFSTFMEARIADFDIKRQLGSHGLGVGASLTSGYTAPELGSSPTNATIKGDVYSFGIVALELISGRSPESLEAGQRLPQWIRETIARSKSLHNVLDPILMGELRVEQQRMAMMLGVALLCARDDETKRPYITEVLKMLEHIKTRPQDGSRSGSARKLRSSLSTHQRNEEIRQEVPGIEMESSPPFTPKPSPLLPTNPSLSHWKPNSAENR